MPSGISYIAFFTETLQTTEKTLNKKSNVSLIYSFHRLSVMESQWLNRESIRLSWYAIFKPEGWSILFDMLRWSTLICYKKRRGFLNQAKTYKRKPDNNTVIIKAKYAVTSQQKRWLLEHCTFCYRGVKLQNKSQLLLKCLKNSIEVSI